MDPPRSFWRGSNIGVCPVDRRARATSRHGAAARFGKSYWVFNYGRSEGRERLHTYVHTVGRPVGRFARDEIERSPAMYTIGVTNSGEYSKEFLELRKLHRVNLEFSIINCWTYCEYSIWFYMKYIYHSFYNLHFLLFYAGRKYSHLRSVFLWGYDKCMFFVWFMTQMQTLLSVLEGQKKFMNCLLLKSKVILK